MESKVIIIQHWWRKLKATSDKLGTIRISPIKIPKDLECINCGEIFFVVHDLCDECYYNKFITYNPFMNDSLNKYF